MARFRIISISRWSWCQNIVALVSVSTAFFYYSQGSERDLNFRALTVTSYHNKPTWKLSRTDKHWSSWSGANERKKSKDIKFSRRREIELGIRKSAFHFKMKSEWSSLGLSKAILDTLEEMQFHTMTPVQVRKLKNKKYNFPSLSTKYYYIVKQTFP